MNGLNSISVILGHIHFIDSCSKLGTVKLHYQGQALRVRAETSPVFEVEKPDPQAPLTSHLPNSDRSLQLRSAILYMLHSAPSTVFERPPLNSLEDISKVLPHDLKAYLEPLRKEMMDWLKDHKNGAHSKKKE